MDAISYIIEIVDQTIKDFEENPISLRHAFLACLATFHTIDYITFPNHPAGRRQQFRSQSEAFDLVERVANAFKHVKSGHEQSKQPALNVGDVIIRPPAVSGTGVWGLSRWDDAVGGITIKGEHEYDLLAIVKQAAEFLRDQIHGGDK